MTVVYKEPFIKGRSKDSMKHNTTKLDPWLSGLIRWAWEMHLLFHGEFKIVLTTMILTNYCNRLVTRPKKIQESPRLRHILNKYVQIYKSSPFWLAHVTLHCGSLSTSWPGTVDPNTARHLPYATSSSTRTIVLMCAWWQELPHEEFQEVPECIVYKAIYIYIHTIKYANTGRCLAKVACIYSRSG